MDESIKNCQIWTKTHSEVIELEAKRSWLFQESASLCDQVQRSEETFSADQQAFTQLQQELTAAEALVASLKTQIASFQFKDPVALLGRSTLDAKLQLEKANDNLPRMEMEIAQANQTMTTVFEKQVQLVHQIRELIQSQD